jgi:hypothetical protein
MGGAILRETRRLKWPGEAAVVVSVVHIVKGEAALPMLDSRQARRISAYLVEGDLDISPVPLAANSGKAFQGSIVLGIGFTFDDVAAAKGIGTSLIEMERLINLNSANAERIFPYIGGEDVNNDPKSRHRRYVIDFEDASEAEARNRWPDLMQIVEKLVKPQRDTDDRKARRERWWRFGDRQPGLYQAIRNQPRVITLSQVSTHHAFTFLPTNAVFDQRLIVFAYSLTSIFGLLQSRTVGSISRIDIER